jgi:hypothetical protein
LGGTGLFGIRKVVFLGIFLFRPQSMARLQASFQLIAEYRRFALDEILDC